MCAGAYNGGSFRSTQHHDSDDDVEENVDNNDNDDDDDDAHNGDGVSDGVTVDGN